LAVSLNHLTQANRTNPESQAVVVPGLAITLLLQSAAAPAASHGARAPEPLDSIDRYVRAEVARQRIPGLSVAVLRGDSLMLARGYGEADVEHHVPAADSTIYQSGSVGKQFTAALIVRLADEGRLRLDDPIARWLPEGPPSWRRITVRRLLTHTSGIPDYADSTLDYRRDYTEDDLVRLAASLPPLFEPGDRWSYSNTGYVLLGAIIHRLTGTFYGDLLRSQVFEPLGMRTARIISERAIVPNRADGYRLVDGRLEHQEWVAPMLNTTADGSLYLTVLDLARWAMGLNHRRYPGPEGLRRSWTPVRLNDGGSYPYGFGWMLEHQRGYPRIGHTGSWQGFKASIQRYPEQNLTVIALANLAEARPEPITFAIAGILEPVLRPPHIAAAAAASGRPPAEPIPALLDRLVSAPDSARLTDGLRRFIADDYRKELREVVRPGRTWTWRGCDDVAAGRIERLGSAIARACYAAGAAADVSSLVEVDYAADGRAAFVTWYDF
jgi:CubicO group peptidase (beta-lactamase class C family)